MAQYAVAAVFGGAAFALAVWGGWRAADRCLPGHRFSTRVLATAVVVLSAVVVSSEALGTVGLFNAATVCTALAVVGLVLLGAARGAGGRAGPRGPAWAPSDLRTRLVAGGVTSAVVGLHLARVAHALRRGIDSYDSLWFHLPTAARFVQTGRTSVLHAVDGGAAIAYYPANSALLHALGMSLFDNDAVSPLLNVGWLALALLAAWNIGRCLDAVVPAVLAVGTVLVLPIMVQTQPGGAYSDLPGTALLLVALAFLVADGERAGRPQGPALALSGLAAGLALGTKWSFVVPVVAMGVVVPFLAPRGRRLRGATAWAVAAAATGSYWYLRNLVRVGSPLPNAHLAVGPLHLTFVRSRLPVDTYLGTLATSAGFRRELARYLGAGLGVAWWALLALAVIGIAVGLGRGDRTARLLAVVTAASFVGFLALPQTLNAVGDDQFFAVVNTRYLAAPLVVAAVLCALVLRGARGLVPLLALLFVVTFLDASAEASRPGTTLAVVGTAAVLAAAATLLGRERLAPPVRRAAVVALLLVALVAGHPLQQSYLRHRYAEAVAFPQGAHWARDLHDQRIAIVGRIPLQYQYAGPDQSNVVQYLGRRIEAGALVPFRSCAPLLAALASGRYSYLVVDDWLSTNGRAEERWMRGVRQARVVHRSPFLTVYRITGRVPTTCA